MAMNRMLGTFISIIYWLPASSVNIPAASQSLSQNTLQLQVQPPVLIQLNSWLTNRIVDLGLKLSSCRLEFYWPNNKSG
ncbi:hypothetical protein BDV27DRAFT_123174 [Aspergillus caelatus]|uniref:Uncharacterized protein n=1 Tax=Aspergillus caelatus TaxID=61420 RepID=A0A5N7ADG8_9EURO|nr:uncharacterized protein BDV27DRAFT_123174 [Aspergillus caelatus]KAE8367914.1 hypothetical protein BDV27DRAFT_123174 [Aspergillus caelatus]